MVTQRIGIIHPLFPTITLPTFLNQVNILARRFEVTCFSLEECSDPVVHADARRWLGKTVYAPPPLSPAVLLSHVCLLLTSPIPYLHVLVKHHEYGGKRLFLVAGHFAWMAKRRRLCHLHAYFVGNSTSVARMMAGLLSITYSCTAVHADIYLNPAEETEQNIGDSLFCVTISRFNKQHLLGKYRRLTDEQIHVVNDGVDVARFRPLPRQDNPIPRILCVARLVPVKNISFLLEVCYALKQEGCRFTCTIVGNGPERTQLAEQIVQLGLRDVAQLPGWLSQEGIVGWYQRADLFVLTSLSEGIPVTLQEAMATELPVVAPRITGIPELVADRVSGLLYESGDLDQAVCAVKRLLQDPNLRRQLGSEGRKVVVEQFNIQRNAQVLARLIQAATSGRRGVSA